MEKLQKYRHWIAIFAVLIVTIAVVAASFGGETVSPSEEPLTAGKAISLYEAAVSSVMEMTDISMTVTQTKTVTISGDAITQESRQELSYTGLGTKKMEGCVDQTLSIGSHIISIQELYCDNEGYFTVAGIPFRGKITEEEYLSRYTPAAPITLEEFSTISATANDAGTKIYFTDATAPEKWLTAEKTDFITSDATAYLDKNGNLIRSDYNTAYLLNGIEFHVHTTVEIHRDKEISIPKHDDKKAYRKIDYLDGPRMLEVACGYLMAADNITAEYTNDISYHVYGDSLTEKITLNCHKGDAWAARVDTEVLLKNIGIGQTVSEAKQTERFVDGEYSISLNGEKVDQALTEEKMRALCRDRLVGTVMLPDYIRSAKVKKTNKVIRITFTAGEDFAAQIRAGICQRLYQEPDLPEQLHQTYTTTAMQCYLELDATSGLPTAAGIIYEGEYQKDSISYLMTSQTHQTYDLVSDTAYNAIHKKES